MAGIVGYGAYIPRNRITVEEIAGIWGADAPSYRKGLLVEEKAVPGPDQDTITMSVEAAKNAIRRAGIDGRDIDAVYIGSESHPYAVKPSGTVVAEALGATPEVHTADLEFACKGGTECMFLALGLVRAGDIRFGLAIGADTSQGAPGDPLEYTAAAGAAAFVFARDRALAECLATYTYATDTPDFWRRPAQHYPSHGGRFTGEPAYFRHVLAAARGIMAKSGAAPGDFRFVVFHQPNGKFPLRAGELLGFTRAQIEPGRLVNRIGNTYSGASLMGLTAALDIASPGDKILLVSYGSGAGSDAFVFSVTALIDEVRARAPLTRDYIDKNKNYLSYGTYARFRGKIRRAE